MARFREWLENVVIDIEVSAGTPSPTVDPSVHVILVGHSMGGIVAADTVISILNDKPIGPGSEVSHHGPQDVPLMFPHIVGIMAFDTPYLGLAPSMFAHGAEGNWNKATSVFGTVQQVASGLFATAGGAAASQSLIKAEAESRERERKEKEKEEAKQTGFLGGWGKVAAITAATTALAGGAAAAYIHREHITNGFTWVSSHLEFVGALMKGEELNNRVQTVSTLPNLGFGNLFTSMGRNFGTNSFYEGKERTFCNIPAQHTPLRKKWYRCINESVKDEVGAHVSMFAPKTNPNYYELADRARQLITVWVPENAFPIVDDYDEEEHSRDPRKKKSKSHKSSSSKREKEKDRDRERRRDKDSEYRDRDSRSGSVSGSCSPRIISRTNSMEPELYSSSVRKSKSDRHSGLSRANTMPADFGDHSDSSSHRKSKSSSRHKTPSRTNSMDVEYYNRENSPASSDQRKSKSHKSSSRTNSIAIDSGLESIRPGIERRGSSREYEVRDREKERRKEKRV